MVLTQNQHDRNRTWSGLRQALVDLVSSLVLSHPFPSQIAVPSVILYKPRAAAIRMEGGDQEQGGRGLKISHRVRVSLSGARVKGVEEKRESHGDQ